MSQENYWLNPVLDEIEEKYPEGEIILSSGISPSASYHVGHFREILTPDIIRWGLEQRGRKVKHLHVIDNFDPLRKRYDFLPEEYEKYVGWPVCLVPDPDGEHDSYADRFFHEFYKWVEKMNIKADVVNSYKDQYVSGDMADRIEEVAANGDKIREIFAEKSNRKLEDDWLPIQILSDNNSFNEWTYKDIDTDAKEIIYSSEDGEGRVSYKDGKVKLNWRLDWPARWKNLNVMVEPHGFQEHGAAGGSFETGKAFAKEIFGVEGPIPGIQYGNVHLIGENTKMSSSKGNLITPDQAFSIMPPEVLRYFYARYPGKKRIDLDPGIGLFRMLDEFSIVDAAVRAGEEHQFSSAYNYAVEANDTPSMIPVPYNHVVSIYQAALGDKDQILKALERSGYSDIDQDTLERQLVYVENWLKDWAPDEVKFELLKNLPEVDLNDNQKKLLAKLANKIESQKDKDAQWYHTTIHDIREEVGLEPKEAFAAVYNVLLNKESGPKAGWFLSILDPKFLVDRFNDGAK